MFRLNICNFGNENVIGWKQLEIAWDTLPKAVNTIGCIVFCSRAFGAQQIH
jgi:hypothetical protein